MRVAAGRHVAAGDVHRDEPLPGDEPRLHLDRELAASMSRCASAKRRTCAVANSMSRLIAGGNVARAPLDLGRAHDDLARPTVELARVLAHRRLAAALDLGQHLRPRPCAPLPLSVSGVFAALFRYSIAMASFPVNVLGQPEHDLREHDDQQQRPAAAAP